VRLFSDLLVIDCASFIAGPAAATILSDFGARVIKVEPPGLGDSYRNLIRLRAPPGTVDYFWTFDSRNKESLALDLANPAARGVLDALIRKADVFITNYPFSTREKFRLRAEDVTPLNARLIYASMTPYGEEGPERNTSGYDTTAWWARSGLMDMVRADGETEAGMSVAGMGDHPTAMALYGAIVTALYRRQATGQGGVVSTSLLANGLWSNGCQIQAALCDLELTPRTPRGARSPLMETYVCADGRSLLLYAGLREREWGMLLAALGKGSWSSDARFADGASRVANASVLTGLLDAAFAEQPLSYWRDCLTQAGVTFGVVGQITDHISDPQIEANQLLPEFADGFGVRTIDSPFQVAGAEKQPPRMAPEIGQHTEAILAELGYGPEDIVQIQGEGGR